MKYKIIMLLSLMFAVSIANTKIGYVNSNRIMAEYEPVRDIQIELEKEQRKLEIEFNRILENIDSLSKDYERQRLLMSDERRQNREQEIMNLERTAQEFQMKKFGPEGDITRMQNQKLQPVLEKVQSAIDVIAKERGYDYVLDAITGSILYALPQYDLTEDVIKELKKNSSSNN
ncbi:MAG: OmpH family outer membrane protein [Candidatus Neomarinimicrobiota bacterium]|jgi:outer membrane protein|nr:OmpH family outer membrane protein [Candidatus Neomarinimicrobiota bacterium]